jgi:hypothetical protein
MAGYIIKLSAMRRWSPQLIKQKVGRNAQKVINQFKYEFFLLPLLIN